ncbi:MAG: DinB family protein [Bryobacterales bacterium]|nr:DinB family protein [Bryobacterales bacterium]MBV9401320.1 DinB family protein [Bryobacterales bacterium]
MSRFLSTTLALSIACAAAFAQNSNAQNPFSADTKQSYTGIKNTLLKAADKMPEENYSFRTTQQVRTYGEMVGHVADIQMMLCGLVKGEQAKPVSAGKTSKADLTAALKQSFDYCDAVYDSMTDAGGATKVNMFGRQVTKLGVLSFNIAHDNEMYGTMVAYLRIKGIVPPSSEGRP